MGYLGRRIGKSQTTANPQADGNTGGILDLFTNGYFQRTGNMPNVPISIYGAPQGLTATGGVISDYLDPSTNNVYRAHIFTSAGTFNVTGSGSMPLAVDYLVIGGGGGGGGAYEGGGGGAGGYRATTPEGPGGPSPVAETQITVSGPFPSPYTITIGAGGAGGANNPSSDGSSLSVGSPGGQSAFYPTPVSYPSPTYIRSEGGGGGGTYNSANGTNVPGIPGGSGGGAGNQSPGTGGPFPGGTGNREANTSTPVPNQGYPGGTRGNQPHAPFYNGSGGGGAGGAAPGNTDNTIAASRGGIGKSSIIAGPANDGIGAPGPSPGRWFAGGGGGGIYGSGQPTGGAGGGTGGPYAGAGNGGVGGGPPVVPASNATYATGAGGGASGETTTVGGNGGSGIVVVRYQIGKITAQAKATGGAISFTPTTTYHVFTSSGTFSPTSDITNAEILVVAGGGGGGGSTASPNGWGGGGGAGGLVYIPPAAPSPVRSIPQASGPYTVLVGGGGAKNKDSFPGSSHQGTDTTFGTSPQPAYLITKGGGGGVTYVVGPTPNRVANPGGSGGGNGHDSPNSTPSATQPSQPGNSGTYGYGYPGGTYTVSAGGGGCGGGGAGQAGFEGRGGANPTPGDGGDGYQVPTSFIPTNFGNYLGFDTPSPQYRYFAGGGAGGAHPSTPGGNTGGLGGGGNGGPAANGDGVDGVMNRGAGGGGIGGAGGNYGGAGGSGVVIIAYPT